MTGIPVLSLRAKRGNLAFNKIDG